jgi:hypothetical protein
VTEREIVEAQIPRLAEHDYRISSPKDPKYNCFAYAAGDTARVWSPVLLGSGVHWPPGIPALPSLTGVIDAYEVVGFERCESPSLEEGYEKIAIFADPASDPRHAARQMPNGEWTSKLGDYVDIEHREVAAVGGEKYGEPVVYMRRATERSAAPSDSVTTTVVMPVSWRS